jgi:hypothetical protein
MQSIKIDMTIATTKDEDLDGCIVFPLFFLRRDHFSFLHGIFVILLNSLFPSFVFLRLPSRSWVLLLLLLYVQTHPHTNTTTGWDFGVRQRPRRP